MARTRFDNLTDKRFGNLVAVQFAGCFVFPNRMLPAWKCACDCGGEKIIPEGRLKSHKALRCGHCRGTHRESVHGRVTPENETWRQMKSRCVNPNHQFYSRYGGRGIKVCDRWIESFDNFLADMGRRPTLAHTIERKDNDGNYEPGNCKWATRQEQANNRSSNTRLEHDGKTQTIAQWAREKGTSPSVICKRISRGMSVKDALKS